MAKDNPAIKPKTPPAWTKNYFLIYGLAFLAVIIGAYLGYQNNFGNSNVDTVIQTPDESTDNSNVDTAVQTPDESIDNIVPDKDTVVQTDESTNNIMPVSNTPELPTKATVTISEGTCVISGLYEGGNPAAKLKGWRFARHYKVTVSGTMSGPVGTDFMLRTTPTLTSTSRTPFEFLCGSWSKNEYIMNCQRIEGSTETTGWSYSIDTYGEVISNLDGVNNIQVKIRVSAGKGYTQLYEDENYAKTLVIKCPLVTY